MKAKELGKKVKKVVCEHAEGIVSIGAGCLIAVACARYGYNMGWKAGRKDITFYTHAAVLGDTDKFLTLAQIGIDKYSGKLLEQLNKEAAKFAAYPLEKI